MEIRVAPVRQLRHCPAVLLVVLPVPPLALPPAVEDVLAGGAEGPRQSTAGGAVALGTVVLDRLLGVLVGRVVVAGVLFGLFAGIFFRPLRQ